MPQDGCRTACDDHTADQPQAMHTLANLLRRVRVIPVALIAAMEGVRSWLRLPIRWAILASASIGTPSEATSHPGPGSGSRAEPSTTMPTPISPSHLIMRQAQFVRSPSPPGPGDRQGARAADGTPGRRTSAAPSTLTSTGQSHSTCDGSLVAPSSSRFSMVSRPHVRHDHRWIAVCSG